jgi:threonine/homoserine/homoserine lactone efflux protein
MSVAEALIAFSIAAGLLTLTPGLDTALVLRTAAADGPRRAGFAALGVCLGVVAWGVAVALGLGSLLLASQTAFDILKGAGAAYLIWLGLQMLLKPRERFETASGSAAAELSAWACLRRGFLNNLLNPKAGVFYVSFLPQFLPVGVDPGRFMVLLAVLHALMGAAWFAVLIGATRPVTGMLRRAPVVRWMDRVTGGLFLGFGVRLAFERR